MAASNVARIEAKPAWAKDLDDREFAWVSSYVGHFNATRAAIDAGCPPKGAHAQAWQIKQRPHIRAAIDAAMRERMPAIKLTIAERLAAIVTTDLSDVIDWKDRAERITSGKGKQKRTRTLRSTQMVLKPAKQLTPAQRAAVKAVKQRVGLYGTSLEVQMHDPSIAAERLSALLGLVETSDKAGGGGTVIFVIEAPDGTVIKNIHRGPLIDGEIVAQGMAQNAEDGPEDLPPGAKPRIVIETP